MPSLNNGAAYPINGDFTVSYDAISHTNCINSLYNGVISINNGVIGHYYGAIGFNNGTSSLHNIVIIIYKDFS